MNPRALFLSGLLFTSAVFCNGAQVSLTADADTGLFQQSPDNNLGAQSFIPLGVSNIGSKCRALLQFDLTAIPTNATIQSATLQIVVTVSNGDETPTINVHRMFNPWVEGTKSGGPGGGVVGATATTGEPT